MKKRIFGETDGIRVKVGEAPLKPGKVRQLAEAMLRSDIAGGPILIGRDTRESGEWIARELMEVFGERAIDCGILPTPAIAKIMADYDDAMAVMVTASHNPSTDNGIKVFKNGTKIPDESELEIEKNYFELENLDTSEREIEGSDAKIELNGDGGVFVEKYAQMAAEALGGAKIGGGAARIVLDAASGAGFEFSRAVFEHFGVVVETIDAAPDGKNINTNCGALYPENAAKKTKELQLPGLALDGDADRCILTDEDGRVWNGDRIVVLLAEYLKEKGELAGDAVVLTEYSNLATVQYLESKGIRVLKVVNGDKAVTDLSLKHGLVLGGEAAGHILYQPWLDSSDGTFMALFVLRILQEKQARLADLWAPYEDKPSLQVPVKVTEKRPLEEIPGFMDAVAQVEQQMAGDGRVFVRYSGTENKLRILLEYTEMAQAQAWGEELAEIVRKEIGDE